jgi:hypothetical protein
VRVEEYAADHARGISKMNVGSLWRRCDANFQMFQGRVIVGIPENLFEERLHGNCTANGFSYSLEEEETTEIMWVSARRSARRT